MRLLKRVLLVLLFVMIAIQFIRPARNISSQVLGTDLTKMVHVPDKVSGILKNSCNDCHSNNTRYPWYVNIQPVAWLMANHVKNGKESLNFSEFGTYSNRKQANKLKSVSSEVEEGGMPISSYTIMHKDAKLNKEDKELIIQWALKTRDSLLSKN